MDKLSCVFMFFYVLSTADKVMGVGVMNSEDMNEA
jgi:hypothetical protein